MRDLEMLSIHQQIMDKLEDELQAAIIDDILFNNDTQAGVVKQGPLQGDPEPDDARISVEIHENDPDSSYGTGNVSSMGEGWTDEVDEVEIGGNTIWSRKFTVKGRCLFDNTGETLQEAQQISRVLRNRLEDTILNISWAGIQTID